MGIAKILVTGSSGTVGTRLCETLLQLGYDIMGLDLKPNKWNADLNKRTVIGDVMVPSTLKDLRNDFDLVIHLAANARVNNLVVNPKLARDNFEMVFRVLDFARRGNICRFLFASSREVYGSMKQRGVSESDVRVQDCESPYGASKIAGESLIHAYHRCYGMDFVIIRFSNLYGMYDDTDRVVPLFIRLTKLNRDLVVYGRQKLLDFTYIDDAVSGVVRCVERFDLVANDVFNIASGEGTSIIELAERVKAKLHRSNRITVKENRVGEVTEFVADISKAKARLGYQPETDFDTGIKKAIDWYEANAN